MFMAGGGGGTPVVLACPRETSFLPTYTTNGIIAYVSTKLLLSLLRFVIGAPK
jgi:hypothetical protein